MTKWERISAKLLQMFVNMVDLCSGLTSITSLMKSIVSSEVNVDFPSNFRKDFIKGLRTSGIV